MYLGNKTEVNSKRWENKTLGCAEIAPEACTSLSASLRAHIRHVTATGRRAISPNSCTACERTLWVNRVSLSYGIHVCPKRVPFHYFTAPDGAPGTWMCLQPPGDQVRPLSACINSQPHEQLQLTSSISFKSIKTHTEEPPQWKPWAGTALCSVLSGDWPWPECPPHSTLRWWRRSSCPCTSSRRAPWTGRSASCPGRPSPRWAQCRQNGPCSAREREGESISIPGFDQAFLIFNK